MTDERNRPKVLVLARNYPNAVTELLGLWVERLVGHSARLCDLKVIAPVPYCPPMIGVPERYARFRRIEPRCRRNGIDVYHPRMLVGPGFSSYRFEWRLYYHAVRTIADRLRSKFCFDLIHAHFTYPDGVVGAVLARRYGVPLVITEHIPWEMWSEKYEAVRQRAAKAAKVCAYHISVSESVRRSVEQCVGNTRNLLVIPNGVDGSIFKILPDGGQRIPNRLVFVGAVRPVKGLDILLKAVRLLTDRGRDPHLDIIGEAFYDSYQKEEARLRRMVTELSLEDRVCFVGKKIPPDLCLAMQQAAVLVLPSRIESFGAVLLEALACGTPVVATRCGGPEEIVNENVGVLVPPENPEALASGIERVLDHPDNYDPAILRAHALERFGLESVGRRMFEVYEKAIHDCRQARGARASIGLCQPAP